jgi:phytoene/squalene synthetase
MTFRALGAVPAVDPVPLPPEPFELPACYRYCEAVARARHHNFPVASVFASSELRPHFFAVFAFARTADDFADEPLYHGRRASELDRWEAALEACFHGESPRHPIFVALTETIARFDLPITPFSSLIAGYRAEIETRGYATFPELCGYTALTAEPMAQLYLYLCGSRDPRLHCYGAELASGLA